MLWIMECFISDLTDSVITDPGIGQFVAHILLTILLISYPLYIDIIAAVRQDGIYVKFIALISLSLFLYEPQGTNAFITIMSTFRVLMAATLFVLDSVNVMLSNTYQRDWSVDMLVIMLKLQYCFLGYVWIVVVAFVLHFIFLFWSLVSANSQSEHSHDPSLMVGALKDVLTDSTQQTQLQAYVPVQTVHQNVSKSNGKRHYNSDTDDDEEQDNEDNEDEDVRTQQNDENDYEDEEEITQQHQREEPITSHSRGSVLGHKKGGVISSSRKNQYRNLAQFLSLTFM